MRKLGVLLVVSILLFVFGCGTFVYELSQISPNQIDLSQETQTMTTTMPDRCRLYTKTYLSSVGDVRVVVDEMVEDNQLPNNSLVITYPKMLHVVQDGINWIYRWMIMKCQRIFKPFLIRSNRRVMMSIVQRMVKFM